MISGYWVVVAFDFPLLVIWDSQKYLIPLHRRKELHEAFPAILKVWISTPPVYHSRARTLSMLSTFLHRLSRYFLTMQHILCKTPSVVNDSTMDPLSTRELFEIDAIFSAFSLLLSK